MTYSSVFRFCLVITTGLCLSGCLLVEAVWKSYTRTIATKEVFVTCHGPPGGKGTLHLFEPDTADSESTSVLYEHAGLQRLKNWTGGLYLPLMRAGQLNVLSKQSDARSYELDARLTGVSGPRSLNFPDYKTGILTDRLPPESEAPDSVHILEMEEFLYDGAPAPEVVKSFAVSGTVADITDVEHSVSLSSKDRVYVALGGESGTTNVAILNSYERTFVTEIDIGCSPRFVTADSDDEVLALCTGGEAVVLDGTSVKERIPLSGPVETAGPGEPAVYDHGDGLYVVISKERVMRINTTTNEPDTTLNLSEGGMIGTVGYDSNNERLYVARADSAAPMRANGTVTIHRRDGKKVGAFQVGKAPVDIDFGWYEVKK